jgi:hypothetical protein
MKWWSTTRFIFFIDFFDAGRKQHWNLGARDSRGIFRRQESEWAYLPEWFRGGKCGGCRLSNP